jgi:hypothetical protein
MAFVWRWCNFRACNLAIYTRTILAAKMGLCRALHLVLISKTPRSAPCSSSWLANGTTRLPESL